MSTRAAIVFKEKITDSEGYCVYKHYDGYPEGMMLAIEKTFEYAWPLPRYEADEFAAAFVAANKSKGGGIRLSHNPLDHDDLEYVYELAKAETNDQLIIRVWSMTEYVSKNINYTGKPIFYGRYKDWKIAINKPNNLHTKKEQAALKVKNLFADFVKGENLNSDEKVFVGALLEAIDVAYNKLFPK